MKRRGPRWLMPLLRYGLCALAIWYLVTHVPWHDQVRLESSTGPKLRLVEQRAEEFVVLRDGAPVAVPRAQVHMVAVNGQQVPDIEFGIRTVVLTIDRGLALLAILIFAPVWFIQSYRLVVMVAIQGVALRYWNAVKLTFAGNFFNFALPGTTGGDLVKAYYISRYTHLKTEVVTTVFLDRAIGLLGIVFLAVAGILLSWNPQRFSYEIIVLGLLLAGLAIGSVIVFSSRMRRALHLTELAARLPGGEQLIRIGRATVAMRQHKAKVAAAMGSTLVLQSIAMVSAAVMAWALGMEPQGLKGLLYYFIYVSIGFLVAAIPSTPQAFGVMEFFYVQFFTQNGLNTASQALALALAVRVIQLVWAIPGVLVPLFGAHLPSAAELEQLEAAAGRGAVPEPAVDDGAAGVTALPSASPK